MNATSSTDMAVYMRFWVGWVLNSVLMGLVALAMAAETTPFAVGVIPSGNEANTDGYSVAWAVIVGGLLAGAALGGIQWLLLRRWFSGGQLNGWWWTGASMIGFGVSFAFVWATSGGMHRSEYAHHGLPHAVDHAETWGGLVIGAAIGVAQWLVLRTRGAQASRAAWWWIPVSTVGFVGGWWVAAVLSAPVEAALGPMTHFWGGAVFGVVFGAISGGALVWLLRRHALASTP